MNQSERLSAADKLEALAWVLVTVGLALGCVIGVCVAGFAGWGCGP